MHNSPTHIAVRPEWLASREEAPIEPALPIVDSHHHLYDRPHSRYLLDDYLQDLYSGHNIRASVYLQARSMLRADAPPFLQPLGETEFANGVAAMSASGLYGPARVCDGIVGYADMMLGDSVRPLLERHLSLAGGLMREGGRFRGVRQSLTWDADSSLMNPAYPISEDMMEAPSFRAAFSHLAPLGLTFDAWVFFPQLPRLAALARAFPETPIVLNHCGGIIGISQYACRRDEVFQAWKSGILQVAACPNVMVKLSGLGMRLGGFGFETLAKAPSSLTLAEAWKPWVATLLECFGARRCMYGSNFPVDKGSHSFVMQINALKRLTADASPDEKDDIFWRSASHFYRLSPPIGDET